MQYFLDTNVLLHYLRRSKTYEAIEEKYQVFGEDNIGIISTVTVGEIRAISLKNGWGEKRKKDLEIVLSKFLIATLETEQIFNRYAEIDAFSQNKLPNKPLHSTARNMGKNDLWIAATASVLDIPLLTSDKDFTHLNIIFNQVELV